jgi:hypothetical protein
MAKRFLVPLNVNVLSSDPEIGSEGDLYFNSVIKSLKIYKNNAWEEIGTDSSASLIPYIDLQIDDVYDVLYGNFLEADDTTDLVYSLDTDDVIEGLTNLYFTEARAIDAVLPTQEGNSGKYLTTDGASVSWIEVEASGSSLPTQEGNSGKYLTTDGASASWGTVDALPSQESNFGKYLTTDGISPYWATLDLDTGIQAASAAATASAFIYTDQQIALVENDPTNISFVRWNKVISASTSTISGLDDNSENLDYTPGIEQVFINGSFIPREDYTSTTGSSIVFNETLYVTDVVEVLCLKTAQVITQEQLATSINRWTKVMSASTSTISGVDDYSNTLDYSIGYTTVFVNGVLIDPSEYTATSGSAVVFDTTVNVDDVVEVLSYRNIGYIWDFYSLLNSASVAATASANSYTDAAIASFEALPSQTGNSGKFLTTDGSNTSWDAIVLDPILYPDYIAFDTAPVLTSASTGTLSWDSGEEGLSLQINPDIDLTIGQEIYTLANNGEATTLNKGEVVMVNGAVGQRPRVIRAYNTSDSTSARTFGIVAENILSGEEGIIITQGIIKNINTDAFNEGDILYLSSTPGQVTTVKPQAPEHYVFVGVVTNKNSSSGRIYVKPQNGYELDEIHDVRITSVQNDDLIVYNSASSIWVNSPKQDIINTASAAAVSYLVDGAPAALDTLNELAAALGDDENFATTVTNTLSTKLDSSTASTTYLTITAASATYEPDIPYVSASPSGPTAGTLWIDSTNSEKPALKVYNGTTWIAVSGSDSGLHPFFTAGI